MTTVKKAISDKKHLLILFSIFLAGVASFALLTVLNHRIEGSDDTIFQTQILPYANVIDWIQYRYANWSGRIFSEGLVYLLSPAPFFIWQILTVFMYGLFSALAFLYYCLFTIKRTPVKDYIMLIFALTALFLMHNAVISDGAIWMTGSIVYFWMATLGLLGLYPIVYSLIRKKHPHILGTIIAIPSLIIATGSQEQVGALLVGLLAVFLAYSVYRFIKKVRGFPWLGALFFILATGSFAISLHAPGNHIRLELELVRWLPDFYTTPLIDRIHYSYRWFLDAVINHTGFVLIISWLSLAALFFSKQRKNTWDYFFIFVFLTAGIFALAKGSEWIGYWFEFYATWKPTMIHSVGGFNIIPWAGILIATVIAPLFLFKRQSLGVLLTLLILAAFAATALMVLSPTMYASSWRSLFIPSVVLFFVAYILVDRVLDAYWNSRYLILTTIVGLSLSQYIYQIARLRSL